MGSVGNSDPWAPYDRYKDCTQGICNEYCPQWCYIVFPPPPPMDDDSGTDFSPLVLAVIGTLASAFFLVIYFTVISKYCRRRRGSSRSGNDQDEMANDQTRQVGPAGLPEEFIKSITVYKYKKSGGEVESTDCSVCLSEFEDGEKLRLLPKCNHAFHLPCIDTWLKSHSSCPLCRFDIGAAKNSPPVVPEEAQGEPPDITVSALVQPGNRSVVVIHDLENGTRAVESEGINRVEANDDSHPKPTSDSVGHRREIVVQIREDGMIPRSFSFDSSSQPRFGIAGVIHSSEEEGRYLPMENRNDREGTAVTVRRSISTGRFIPGSFRPIETNRI